MLQISCGHWELWALSSKECPNRIWSLIDALLAQNQIFFFCSVFTQFVPGTCTISASCDLSTSVQPPEKPRTPFHEHHIVFYFPLASSIHLKPHFHPQTYSTSSQFSIPKADQYLSSSIYIALNQGANRGWIGSTCTLKLGIFLSKVSFVNCVSWKKRQKTPCKSPQCWTPGQKKVVTCSLIEDWEVLPGGTSVRASPKWCFKSSKMNLLFLMKLVSSVGTRAGV